MNNTAILYPMVGLAWWSAVVYLVTLYLRLSHSFAGDVRLAEYTVGEPDATPTRTRQANRNIMNLFEMPVLYYFTGTLLYVTDNVTAATVGFAWAYFGLRIVHSLVHLTYNNVLHRSVIFAFSAVAAVLMLAALTRALLM